jgi:hypothetical protein
MPSWAPGSAYRWLGWWSSAWRHLCVRREVWTGCCGKWSSHVRPDTGTARTAGRRPEPDRIDGCHLADLHRGDRRRGACLALATSVNELLWIPLVGFAVWLVLWRATFSTIENAFSLLGLTLVVFAVAVWQLSPDWESLWAQASQPSVPSAEGIPTYFYYAVALSARR